MLDVANPEGFGPALAGPCAAPACSREVGPPQQLPRAQALDSASRAARTLEYTYCRPGTGALSRAARTSFVALGAG